MYIVVNSSCCFVPCLCVLCIRHPNHLLDEVGIQIGSTKVFLRQHAYDVIESLRSQTLELCSTLLQSTIRGYLVRNRYSRVYERIIALQAVVRGYLVCKHVERQQTSAVTIQCMYRSKVARCEFVELTEAHRKKLKEEEQMRKKATQEQAAMEREVTEKAVLQVAKLTTLDVLQSELERLKMELESAKAVAAESKSRAAKLEAENNMLKHELKKEKQNVEYKRGALAPSQYAEFPDLRELAESVGMLTFQSKQSKKDLDALVKSLEKLK